MADGRLLRPLYMGHVRLWGACPIRSALQSSVAALGFGGMARGGAPEQGRWMAEDSRAR